jgi:hypothetical protein
MNPLLLIGAGILAYKFWPKKPVSNVGPHTGTGNYKPTDADISNANLMNNASTLDHPILYNSANIHIGSNGNSNYEFDFLLYSDEIYSNESWILNNEIGSPV